MLGFKEFITEGVYDPDIFKVVYICGPAGAGKSFIGKKITGGSGLRVVNSDDTFEHMLKKAEIEPDFNKMSKEQEREAQDIRKKSRRIMFRKKDNYIDGRIGMLIDTPGTKVHFILDDKYALEQLGYECFMVFVTVKLATAKERNSQRKRKIPTANLESDYKSIMGNIEDFKEAFGANFILINNNNTSDEVFDQAWKKIRKFLDSPVKNWRAKKWIKQQKALKRGK